MATRSVTATIVGIVGGGPAGLMLSHLGWCGESGAQYFSGPARPIFTGRMFLS